MIRQTLVPEGSSSISLPQSLSDSLCSESACPSKLKAKALGRSNFQSNAKSDGLPTPKLFLESFGATESKEN